MIARDDLLSTYLIWINFYIHIFSVGFQTRVALEEWLTDTVGMKTWAEAMEQGIWTRPRHTTVESKQGVIDNHDAAVYIWTRTATDGKPI